MLGEEHLSPQERLNHGVVVPKYILLVGYSYGSIISASASASIPTCVGVVSIAPPLAVRHWLYVFHGNYHLDQAKKRHGLPRLMVIGSEDNFTSEEIFQQVVKTFPKEATTGAVLKGADHFFQRREKDLMDILGKKSTSGNFHGRND
jgi:alpha/beta superfamily hydrolase